MLETLDFTIRIGSTPMNLFIFRYTEVLSGVLLAKLGTTHLNRSSRHQLVWNLERYLYIRKYRISLSPRS